MRSPDGRVYRQRICTNCDEYYYEVGSDEGEDRFGVGHSSLPPPEVQHIGTEKNADLSFGRSSGPQRPKILTLQECKLQFVIGRFHHSSWTAPGSGTRMCLVSPVGGEF